MIKLKHLIKEETIHSCDCGGDCCSVNESKGMEKAAGKRAYSSVGTMDK